MSEEDLKLLRLAGFVLAVGLAFLWQRLAPHGGLRGSMRCNGGLWLVNLAVVGTLCGACVCSAARWAEAGGIGVLPWFAAPALVAFPATLLVLDLVSYGWHRANHAVPFLWRWHQVHHSDPSFTVSTALRFHPGELLLSLPLRIAAVVVLGAPATAVVLFEVAFTFSNSVEHGDIDLPPGLERVMSRFFVTPALHRWHHVASVPDRDSNYGTVFSFWDRLFRTLVLRDSSTRVRTGLPGVSSVTFRDALGMPLRGQA